MSDEILKAYGRHTAIDDAMHVINTIDHGFDGYFWVSRVCPYSYYLFKTEEAFSRMFSQFMTHTVP